MKVKYIILLLLFFTSCGSLTELKMLNCEIEGDHSAQTVPLVSLK